MVTRRGDAPTPRQIRERKFNADLLDDTTKLRNSIEGWIHIGRQSEKKNTFSGKCTIVVGKFGDHPKEFESEAVAAITALVEECRQGGWEVKMSHNYPAYVNQLEFSLELSDG